MMRISLGLETTIAIAIISIALMLIGYRQMVEVKRINNISLLIPAFTSSLLEAMKTGLVLSEAIVLVADSTSFEYITPLLRVAASKIKKGMSVAEALGEMARKLRNPLFSHVVSVISKIEETGGDVTGILEKVEQYVEGNVKASYRRSTDMNSYAMVSFISFGVLMFTLMIAVMLIFPKLTIASTIAPGGLSIAGNFGTSISGIHLVTWSFYIVSIIYAYGNGLISGIFLNGSVRAGLFYAGILAAVTALAFYVASGGLV
ncbi:MAG: type II secretion system F family protein [Candidatus Parvarchaeota archaeon]